LMPRLPRFNQAHPHLAVSLLTSEHGLAGQRGNIDVAIMFGDGRSKHGEARRLFREKVFPVFSTRLVERLQLSLPKDHLARL
ncbi:LysR substrate-binding domain-containing protein, partial [Pseudomonas aeruginosa]